MDEEYSAKLDIYILEIEESLGTNLTPEAKQNIQKIFNNGYVSCIEVLMDRKLRKKYKK